MITNGNSLRLKIELEAAAEVHLPEVVAGFLRVLGDDECVLVVIQQCRVFVREGENGRRLGGHDRVALTHGFGEFGYVLCRNHSGWFQGAGGDHRHAGVQLVLPDEHGDAVVPHHGD